MIRSLAGLLALACLVACLAVAILYFRGAMTVETFRQTFLLASLCWFVFAGAWGSMRE
jgi:hypothetical protein